MYQGLNILAGIFVVIYTISLGAYATAGLSAVWIAIGLLLPWTEMDYTKLNPRFRGAKVEEISGDDHRKVYRLSLQGKADKYRLAQLDDYTKTREANFFALSHYPEFVCTSLKRLHPWNLGIWTLERSIRIVAWVWRESISIACVAECGLVL